MDLLISNTKTMAVSLPNFPNFPVHESNAETRWRKWTSRLENLFIGWT